MITQSLTNPRRCPRKVELSQTPSRDFWNLNAERRGKPACILKTHRSHGILYSHIHLTPSNNHMPQNNVEKEKAESHAHFFFKHSPSTYNPKLLTEP
jgi:hypothetical protein